MKLDRTAQIRRYLFTTGYSSVGEIAEAVGASEPTVRRDLLALEAAGVILRRHGGAEIAGASGSEVAFEAREAIHLGSKRAIGEAAYQRLRPNTAVFLDAGTTVLQLARLLRVNPMPLRVFSNCLAVAQLLMAVPQVSVTLLGGQIRPQNASVVGGMAEEALGQLWFDQLFLGVGAVAANGDITSADAQEARLNRAMLARAQSTVILADAAKFGPRLTWRVAGIGPEMQVISAPDLTPEWHMRLAEWGAALTLAGPLD